MAILANGEDMSKHTDLMKALGAWDKDPASGLITTAEVKLADALDAYRDADVLVLEGVSEPVKCTTRTHHTNETIKYKGKCYRLPEVQDE